MFAAGERIGHYEVIRPLDKGGMGYVYLVRHATLGVEYAVKVLKPEFAEDKVYAARFLHEGRLASRIRHPNLIAVYDAGRDEATGANYLVMDYVPGGTLAQLIQKEGALPPVRALEIVRQVAGALAAAGEHGMVHRDIKPANIMFDRDGRVKLADLGIAKGGEDVTAMTCSDSVFGTPAYMSPEQARDSGKVDCRTDIYSLGMVLWQMLTGERPYADQTAAEIMLALLDSRSFPDVRKRNPAVPRNVAALVRDMCHKKREKRIPSAVALLDRLDGLVSLDDETEPTVCADQGRQQVRPSRTGRKMPILLAAATLLVLLAFFVSVGVRRLVKASDGLVAEGGGDSGERAATERLAAERQEAGRLASEKLRAEKEEALRLASEREARRLAEEKAEAARREADQIAAKEAEVRRQAEEARRLAEKKAEEERREAERLAAKNAEESRLAEEARLAASAMVDSTAVKKPEPKPVEPKKRKPQQQRDIPQLAMAAFKAGNWSLGYQYALQDTTGNPEVLFWLGKCFDPAVEMPGFHRHKKDPDLARRYYQQSAEKGNAEAGRALKRL